MNVMWSLGQEKPRIISGQHKPGTPRIWAVVMNVESETHGQRFLVNSKGKLTMLDMHDVVMRKVREFEADFGEVIKVSYTAHAR